MTRAALRTMRFILDSPTFAVGNATPRYVPPMIMHHFSDNDPPAYSSCRTTTLYYATVTRK